MYSRQHKKVDVLVASQYMYMYASLFASAYESAVLLECNISNCTVVLMSLLSYMYI